MARYSSPSLVIEYCVSGIRVSTIHNGYRVSRLYIGYSKKEAVAEFQKMLD